MRRCKFKLLDRYYADSSSVLSFVSLSLCFSRRKHRQCTFQKTSENLREWLRKKKQRRAHKTQTAQHRSNRTETACLALDSDRRQEWPVGTKRPLLWQVSLKTRRIKILNTRTVPTPPQRLRLYWIQERRFQFNPFYILYVLYCEEFDLLFWVSENAGLWGRALLQSQFLWLTLRRRRRKKKKELQREVLFRIVHRDD